MENKCTEKYAHYLIYNRKRAQVQNWWEKNGPKGEHGPALTEVSSGPAG